jgi:hypothetical protein
VMAAGISTLYTFEVVMLYICITMVLPRRAEVDQGHQPPLRAMETFIN